MYKHNDAWVFSPSDLTLFWESEFAAWMERFVKEVPDCGIAPDSEDGMQKVLQSKGFSHEKKTMQKLLGDGLIVVVIEQGDHEKGVADTIAAMRSGADVIYQAYLTRGSFAGYADFLVKVPGESKLGAFHYEAWDTKLSSKLKPYFVIQLCAYSEMLEEIQGRLPDGIVVVLGNGRHERLRLHDYLHYYRSLVERFLAFHNSFDQRKKPSPEKFRSFGKWSSHAEELLRKADSLAQVAGISVNQIKNLHRAGITTMTQLASAPDQEVPRMSNFVFRRLRKQCQVQKGTAVGEKPAFEVNTDCERGKGLWRLPRPSQNDVYFDIEGYPLVDGGLEYLWGSVHFNKGKPQFKDFWAHNPVEEKAAFEAFVDWIYSRWTQDPSMHVYHYAAYEVNAIKRLMGRYASREREVDDLLRGGVFIDLYAVVKQGIWIGAGSYSIKTVELIYRSKRATAVMDGGASVEFYQAWIDHPDGATWEQSRLLRDIRDYNKDDCDSTFELAEWLRGLQKAAGIPFYDRPQEESHEDDSSTKVAEDEELTKLRSALVRRVAECPEAELLSQLIDFHRREQKPKWWRFFERLNMTEAELRDDDGCIGGLKRTEKPDEVVKRSKLVHLSYSPTQETKIRTGDRCYLHHDPEGTTVEVYAIDSVAGAITLKVGNKREIPDRLSIIPSEVISAKVLRDGIVAVCDEWVSGGVGCLAVTRFLRGEKPHISNHGGGPLVADEGSVESVTDLVRQMDQTTLCIQGPPGAGKTYLGKHLIASLLDAGKVVGIVSNSHKAVNNLMIQAVELCAEAGVPCTAIKVSSEEEEDIAATGLISRVESGSKVAYGDAVNLIGGTAWTFANEIARGQLDYLFIDEAGQVSLANFVAMGLSAKNFILLGDQMQLSQPIEGSHPGRSGLSCLEFLLGDRPTIPPDVGVFLGFTRRMHPEVCGFVSRLSYEGRLRAHESCRNRVVRRGKKTDGGEYVIHREAGLVFVPVEHEGNSRASEEEVEIVRAIVEELLDREHTGHDGSVVGKIKLQDILIIAPYNLHVGKLKDALGDGAKVGSIDKFQGQEAPVVILSMGVSSLGEGSGRGIDFLFSRNRLNVALSRAQSLAIVVGHPRLALTNCSSVKEMGMVSAYCQLVRYK